MTSVAISQPFLFPWVGAFELINNADIFVYYDDVQFSKRSFINRVQIKSSSGIKWMTIPLKKPKIHDLINEISVCETPWRKSHFDFIKQAYAKSPFLPDVLSILEAVYFDKKSSWLIDILKNGMAEVFDYFDLFKDKHFFDASTLNVQGCSSRRVLDIVLSLNADTYITAHGAKNYLQHDEFEKAGVCVKYVDYQMKPYCQQFSDFTAYTSILDLVANEGKEGRDFICSGVKYWRDFLNDI